MPTSQAAQRIGIRPGQLQKQASSARIFWTVYNGQDLSEGECEDFSDLPQPPENANLWLDIVGVPGLHGLSMLEKAYGLHRLALEDVQSGGQLPKFEEFDDHLYSVFQIPQHAAAGTKHEQLNLFIKEQLVVSIHPVTELFEPVRRRLHANKGVIRTAGSAYLMYAIADLSVDMDFPVAEQFADRLLQLEERAEDGRQDLSRDIYALRRPLSALLRQAERQRDVVACFLERDREVYEEAYSLYWRDCLDHAERYYEAISHLRENAGDLLNTHLALVSHRMNDVMKVLTVMSTLFIPLSFVVGLYGMNFNTESASNMPELSWRYGYLYVWGLMLLIATGILFFFRRKQWI